MGVRGIMQRAAKTTLYAYSACTMIIYSSRHEFWPWDIYMYGSVGCLLSNCSCHYRGLLVGGGTAGC